jgi:hypothetical protein
MRKPRTEQSNYQFRFSEAGKSTAHRTPQSSTELHPTPLCSTLLYHAPSCSIVIQLQWFAKPVSPFVCFKVLNDPCWTWLDKELPTSIEPILADNANCSRIIGNRLLCGLFTSLSSSSSRQPITCNLPPPPLHHECRDSKQASASLHW